MSTSTHDHRLRRLAVLYLSVAHDSDDVLTETKLESVTRRLVDRSGGADRAAVQSILMDVLRQFTDGENQLEAVRTSAEALHGELTVEQMVNVLSDLQEAARAGGVVLNRELQMLQTLAESWGIRLEHRSAEEETARWGVLHDLAYVYLVLAHGIDNDLSDSEVQVILNKLQEWQPDVPTVDVHRMLRLATAEYAEGQDEDRLGQAIRSVRSVLPRAQRMAALNDLVKIANADGVFLDDEEDLINRLQTEWDVDPSANYEPHSDKAVDG